MGQTQTHKHRGLSCSAQPQVLEPVLLVLALPREPFHPGLAGQRGARLGRQAAQHAHGLAPARGASGRGGDGAEADTDDDPPHFRVDFPKERPAGSCAKARPRVTSGFGSCGGSGPAVGWEDGCGSGLQGAGARKNRSYPAVGLRSREEDKVIIQGSVPSGNARPHLLSAVSMSRPSWGFSRLNPNAGAQLPMYAIAQVFLRL